MPERKSGQKTGAKTDAWPKNRSKERYAAADYAGMEPAYGDMTVVLRLHIRIKAGEGGWRHHGGSE